VSDPDPYALPPGLVKIQPGMLVRIPGDEDAQWRANRPCGEMDPYAEWRGLYSCVDRNGFRWDVTKSGLSPDLRPGPDGKSDPATCYLVAEWLTDYPSALADLAKTPHAKWFGDKIDEARRRDGKELARLAREIGESR
jgi:hypothetical protein